MNMNTKIANLLRSVADVIEETGDVTKEITKEVKTELPLMPSVKINGEDPVEKVRNLMKRVDENDKVNAYKNKVKKESKKLKTALETIEKLRDEAWEGLMSEERFNTEHWAKVKENMGDIIEDPKTQSRSTHITG